MQHNALAYSLPRQKLTQFSPPNTPLLHWCDLLNQTLMNAHLIRIPRLTPLTTRRLPRGNFQALGRETDWALDAEVLALRTLDELLADLFEALDFARGQGDADFMDFLWREGTWAMLASYFGRDACEDRKWRVGTNVRVLRRSPFRVFGRTCCVL